MMRFSLKSCRVALVIALLAIGSSARAFATTLLVTESGTFSSSTPTSSFSTANGTFSISFLVNSQPTVSANSDHFDVTYSNFSFLLNGVANTTPVSSISFFTSNSGGLFSVCFTSACPAGSDPTNGLEFLGPQAYSGTLQNPTILTGSYATDKVNSSVAVNGNLYAYSQLANANITTANSTSVAATPEPSSLALLGTGLLSLAGGVRRRFVQTRS